MNQGTVGIASPLFFFKPWASCLLSKGTEPLAALSFLLPFLSLGRIPIDLPMEDKRLALEAIPFRTFFAFPAFVSTKETIDRTTGVGSFFFWCPPQLQRHHTPEEELQTIVKTLLLCFLFLGFGKLVGDRRNGTVGAPVLAFPFFEALPYTDRNANWTQKVGIGCYSFPHFFGLSSQSNRRRWLFFVCCFWGCPQLQQHHTLEEEQQTIVKASPSASLLSFFGCFCELVAEQRNGTVRGPFLLPFLLLGHIRMDMPTKRKVGIGCFPFSYLFWFFKHSS